MASATRSVQLCQIITVLIVLVLAIVTLAKSGTAGDAAKDYQTSQEADLNPKPVASQPPALPVAQCQRNSTGCCEFKDPGQNVWSSYTFCDSSCATLLRNDALKDSCVSQLVVVGDALKSADVVIGWTSFVPACVLCVTALLANASPRYVKWRAGGLCCVNCVALIPMGIGLGLAIAAAALVNAASTQTQAQCTYICKDIHGDDAPKTSGNAVLCTVAAALHGVNCDDGTCCFQSDLDAMETLAASTTPPVATAAAGAILVLLMSCCSIGACVCGKGEAAAAGGLHAPLSVNAPSFDAAISGGLIAPLVAGQSTTITPA